MRLGDICRAKCTAPARYVDKGLCLYVSAQDNEIMMDKAAPAKGGEKRLPLPSDEMLQGAWAALLHVRVHFSTGETDG